MAEIAWRVLVQSNLALWSIKIAYIHFFAQSSEQLVRLNLMAFTFKLLDQNTVLFSFVFIGKFEMKKCDFFAPFFYPSDLLITVFSDLYTSVGNFQRTVNLIIIIFPHFVYCITFLFRSNFYFKFKEMEIESFFCSLHCCFFLFGFHCLFLSFHLSKFVYFFLFAFILSILYLFRLRKVKFSKKKVFEKKKRWNFRSSDWSIVGLTSSYFRVIGFFVADFSFKAYLILLILP